MPVHFGFIFPSPMISKSCSFLPSIGGHLPQREIYVLLRSNGEGQRAFLVFISAQLPSAQNNSHAKVTYIGVAYSDPLQRQIKVNS